MICQWKNPLNNIYLIWYEGIGYRPLRVFTKTLEP